MDANEAAGETSAEEEYFDVAGGFAGTEGVAQAAGAVSSLAPDEHQVNNARQIGNDEQNNIGEIDGQQQPLLIDQLQMVLDANIMEDSLRNNARQEGGEEPNNRVEVEEQQQPVADDEMGPVLGVINEADDSALGPDLDIDDDAISTTDSEEHVENLVAHARHAEGGIAGLLNRDNFMQRVRSMIYSLERNRHRHEARANADAIDVADDNGVEEMETDPIDEVMQAQNSTTDEENEDSIRFDTNLPAEHSYFGGTSNRVPGVNYLDEGTSHHMLIFMHQHLLFPGEILPFMINSSVIDEEMEGMNGHDGLTFGIVFPFLQENVDNPIHLYGVTCQIYEKGESNRETAFYKSRALQRFILNCDSFFGGRPQYIASNPTIKCHGVAKILPEIYLPEPLKCINMGSMNRFRDIDSMKHVMKRYQAATTAWPAHVFDEYSISWIVEKARKQLERHKIDTMPTCPIQLSYWLVRNLHLTESLTRTIYLTDSVNTRLKLIAGAFKEDSLFFCRYCNNSIANCKELFAMSKHGVQTQYCNSAGYIHETNTVYRLLPDSVNYSGEPSTEFSWFPGYQWRIIVCKFCTQHIGWEFKALKPNVVPKLFFGLSGSSVRINKENSSAGNNNMRPFVYRSLLRLINRQLE